MRTPQGEVDDNKEQMSIHSELDPSNPVSKQGSITSRKVQFALVPLVLFRFPKEMSLEQGGGGRLLY